MYGCHTSSTSISQHQKKFALFVYHTNICLPASPLANNFTHKYLSLPLTPPTPSLSLSLSLSLFSLVQGKQSEIKAHWEQVLTTSTAMLENIKASRKAKGLPETPK
mmetsp:Transcript_13717/g.21907  ORF Transcript_13717/g.21907 Transcript_13717/m.21907 type:complete len:106 (-) Transcript_13717:153-470(-)